MIWTAASAFSSSAQAEGAAEEWKLSGLNLFLLHSLWMLLCLSPFSPPLPRYSPLRNAFLRFYHQQLNALNLPPAPLSPSLPSSAGWLIVTPQLCG